MCVQSVTAEAVVADCQPLIRDLVFKWSGMCQNFLDWERSEMLLKEPTPDHLKVHRSWVNALLRMGHSLGPIVLDPEYPDGRTATELPGMNQELEALVSGNQPAIKFSQCLLYLYRVGASSTAFRQFVCFRVFPDCSVP